MYWKEIDQLSWKACRKARADFVWILECVRPTAKSQRGPFRDYRLKMRREIVNVRRLECAYDIKFPAIGPWHVQSHILDYNQLSFVGLLNAISGTYDADPTCLERKAYGYSPP